MNSLFEDLGQSASKVLRNRRTSKVSKSAAGSALTQRCGKGKCRKSKMRFEVH